MSRIQSGSFAANPTFGNFPQLRTSTDHRNSSTAPPKYTKLETHVVSDVLTTSAHGTPKVGLWNYLVLGLAYAMQVVVIVQIQKPPVIHQQLVPIITLVDVQLVV